MCVHMPMKDTPPWMWVCPHPHHPSQRAEDQDPADPGGFWSTAVLVTPLPAAGWRAVTGPSSSSRPVNLSRADRYVGTGRLPPQHNNKAFDQTLHQTHRCVFTVYPWRWWILVWLLLVLVPCFLSLGLVLVPHSVEIVLVILFIWTFWVKFSTNWCFCCLLSAVVRQLSHGHKMWLLKNNVKWPSISCANISYHRDTDVRVYDAWYKTTSCSTEMPKIPLK